MTLLSEYNKDVTSWGQGTRRQLKLTVLQLTTRYSGAGEKNQTVKVKKYRGEAAKIDFGFPVHMVFVHKGAGRGYGGSKTGLFTRSNGSKGKTAESSKGKMGTGKRVAKPWFNPVLEARFPLLADLVANYHGGKVILAMEKILVK